MGNVIARNTTGRARDAIDSIKQSVGRSLGRLDYIKTSTKNSVFTGLNMRTGTKGRQLGKAVQTHNKYRIYGSINPPIQVVNGRLAVHPAALTHELNTGINDEHEKITCTLGNDGIMRYQIYTGENKQQQLRLKQMDTDTQERVASKVSTAIDNTARRTAGQAVLADLMQGDSFSVKFSSPNNPAHDRVLTYTVSDMYDFITGEYRNPDNKRHKDSEMIQTMMPKFQEALIAKLQKKKTIDSNTTRDDITHNVMNATPDSLSKKQVQAHRHNFRQNYGVGRYTPNTSDVAVAKEKIKPAVKQSTTTTPTTINNTASASTTNNTLSKQVQDQLNDYLKHPEDHNYADVLVQLTLWHNDGTLTDEQYTNNKAVIDMLEQAGKFDTSKVIPLTTNNTNADAA